MLLCDLSDFVDCSFDGGATHSDFSCNVILCVTRYEVVDNKLLILSKLRLYPIINIHLPMSFADTTDTPIRRGFG